mgnify:CR=1 FL=1
MPQDTATSPFNGSYTALITPFSNGKVNEAAFRKLVDFQIENGTHGLVPVGTTGESPTLSHEEHDRVVEMCIEQAAGRVPVSVPNRALTLRPTMSLVEMSCRQ